uniref:Uncharacterized protein n=1 Tax=viral metagenome TaxID=1070528 RepID=A0A6C0B542_9ZZZZ
MSDEDSTSNSSESSSCSTPSSIHVDMTANDSYEDIQIMNGVTEDSMHTIQITPAPSISKDESVVEVPKSSWLCPWIKPVKTDDVPKDNQDTNQKIGVATTVAVEFYRALVASFLILFVPQSCGDHVCSFSENAQTGPDPLYNAGFAFNCITMAAFAALYYAEVRREGKLIAYLDVNPAKPSDNDSVGQVLEKMPKYRSDGILYYDSLYTKAGYTVITCFSINTVLSGLVVYKYYLDDKTTTTYITSVLFVIQKLIQVYATLKTDKNVFYSAYLSGKIQYNDMDKDKDEPKV